MNDILKLRGQIDSLDNQILDLISERGKLAKKIGRRKKKNGDTVHVPSREKKIYERLIKLNRGPYKSEAVVAIFREIISATRALEAPLKVAYLGPEATFTHLAAQNHFGSSAETVPVFSIPLIFEEVERGHADYGVVPIENSTEGVVSHTLDRFAETSLKVCGEVILRVAHHLLSHETGFSRIKKVYSHPHALAQCRKWLGIHLPHAVLKETESTAEAARKAASESGAAAISSKIASAVYRLPILEKEIQDLTQNYTRFLVIGTHAAGKTGEDKTSLLFIIHDEAGGLFKILEPLARAHINLTKIQSRPLKRKVWEYMFFVDMDGHVEDSRVARALEAVKRKCVLFQILGSYPKSQGYA